MRSPLPSPSFCLWQSLFHFLLELFFLVWLSFHSRFRLGLSHLYSHYHTTHISRVSNSFAIDTTTQHPSLLISFISFSTSRRVLLFSCRRNRPTKKEGRKNSPTPFNDSFFNRHTLKHLSSHSSSIHPCPSVLLRGEKPKKFHHKQRKKERWLSVKYEIEEKMQQPLHHTWSTPNNKCTQEQEEILQLTDLPPPKKTEKWERQQDELHTARQTTGLQQECNKMMKKENDWLVREKVTTKEKKIRNHDHHYTIIVIRLPTDCRRLLISFLPPRSR